MSVAAGDDSLYPDQGTHMHLFRDAFPDRFIQVGIAEQNLVTVASGLARAGKVPFISSYAAFSPGRNWEYIKTTVALNDMPVKIIGPIRVSMWDPMGRPNKCSRILR